MTSSDPLPSALQNSPKHTQNARVPFVMNYLPSPISGDYLPILPLTAFHFPHCHVNGIGNM